MNIQFNLDDRTDPEERLEQAILWKLMHDFYGDKITLVDEIPTYPYFGVCNPLNRNMQIGGEEIEYWNDPIFFKHCKRYFRVVDIAYMPNEIEHLHNNGKDVFVKSTRAKHFLTKIPIGVNWQDEFEGMEYSFIDGGPKIMVQEFIELEQEQRFFVINSKIITWAKCEPTSTPLDYLPDACIDLRLLNLAQKYVSESDEENYVLDTGINKSTELACVVELNPMALGQVGLFDCNVHALVKASEHLL